MKNWREIYKSRVVSAHEAVSRIKSGNRVVVAHASGSPEVLLKALVKNKDAYKNVEIVHMVSMGASEYCLPEMEKHFVHNSLFAGATTRKAIHDGRACFTVSHFSQIPRLFIEKILPVDVTLCMVSLPDEHGFCSFGVSVDYTKPAAESSKLVIAEVTPNMPRTLGDAFIHVSQIDCIVETRLQPHHTAAAKDIRRSTRRSAVTVRSSSETAIASSSESAPYPTPSWVS